VRKSGVIIANKDLLTKDIKCRKDIKAIILPFNQMAMECEDKRVANTVALGVFIASLPRLIGYETVESVLKQLFSPGETLEQNIRAFKLGAEK
jgi:Pyruvate/2-oxoacid:ferredoxin oxidoreductase gamma subunit